MTINVTVTTRSGNTKNTSHEERHESRESSSARIGRPRKEFSHLFLSIETTSALSRHENTHVNIN
jgi:hypothetical protein